MKFNKSLSSTERLDELQHFIEKSKHVSIEEICEKFNVSAATARRDLYYLSNQGLIMRVHGGAVALHQSPPENPVFQRMSNQEKYKKHIGIMTASLINPGSTIFLGSGTTVLEVARNIKQIPNLTIITNSYLVINELIDCQNITLIDLGGIIRRSELSAIGSLTENALYGLNAEKVIIGIHGIDIEQGLTNQYLPEAITDRKILQISKKIILVADHTKFGQISTSFVAPLSILDTIVTDLDAPKEILEILIESGITVLQA
jgi:DeoR/GlpR family transcriptional regulator of sugar metabolism